MDDGARSNPWPEIFRVALEHGSDAFRDAQLRCGLAVERPQDRALIAGGAGCEVADADALRLHLLREATTGTGSVRSLSRAHRTLAPDLVSSL
ncbi:hypothetical protein [Microbacterium sp. 2FI]|uniref:hypothetical protein n=1 Tax=Microbacterium sp. 2FI TaxID=2502193 RepID=UPI002015FD6A|nr:hypothetical protein [Microbacterium sp. 2FI]